MANQSILLSRQESTTQCTHVITVTSAAPVSHIAAFEGITVKYTDGIQMLVCREWIYRSSENRCSAALWQAVSQSGAYVQYSRLLSVLSQGGMSSVSSGVTEAQKYEASRWTSTLVMPSTSAICCEGETPANLTYLAMAVDWHEHATQ